jgi:hypothetical protein
MAYLIGVDPRVIKEIQELWSKIDQLQEEIQKLKGPESTPDSRDH